MEMRKREPARWRAYCDQVSDLVQDSFNALQSSQGAEKFASLMNANQKILGELGLVTSTAQALLTNGLQLGALGGKISGAGLGGVLFFAAKKGEGQRLLIGSGTRARKFSRWFHEPASIFPSISWRRSASSGNREKPTRILSTNEGIRHYWNAEMSRYHFSTGGTSSCLDAELNLSSTWKRSTKGISDRMRFGVDPQRDLGSRRSSRRRHPSSW